LVSRNSLKKAFDKDKVIVKIKVKDKLLPERLKGEIIKVIHAAQTPMLGLIKKQEEHVLVLPLSDIYPYPLKINQESNSELNDNQIVSFFIKPNTKPNIYPTAEIIDIIGSSNDNNIDEKIIVSLFNIKTDFPEEVKNQAKSFEPFIPNYSNRLNLTDKVIFTIDGEDAKDFDDAVSIEMTDASEYLLGVHIADVSNFVRQNSTIDTEAYARGTSIYFPDKAIHMLPPALSENICSLQPNQPRYTISILMSFNKKGKLLKYKIAKSVINSKARLTYNIVQEILDNPSKHSIDSSIINSLLRMNELAQLLNEKRTQNGALDFDLPEPIIMLDRQANIAEISKSIRLNSHKIIEEFMIVANEVVATHLKKKQAPLLYRIHEVPEMDKINNFLTIFQNMGYKVPTPIIYDNPKFYQRLLFQVEGKPYANFITYLLLRSFKQAKYSENNLGHFGLASTCYTHFTSPIRRYPDLFNHRILSILLQNSSNNKLKSFKPITKEIAEHCSQMERVADEAERKLINMKRARFMQQFIGETFNGIITNMNSKKIFVEIIEHYVEGFIPIPSLLGDFYYFDENKYMIIGKRYKKTFKLGDLIKVKIIGADPLRSIIELRNAQDV